MNLSKVDENTAKAYYTMTILQLEKEGWIKLIKM